MQKIINGIAIASGIVSLSVVGIGGYVYLNKDAIIQEVTEKAIGRIGLGGGLIAFSLFFGINPTLVMSVVAAPIWVGLVFLCNRITKIAITLKDIPEPDIKTTKSRRK